jgi:heat shock protein HslJ
MSKQLTHLFLAVALLLLLAACGADATPGSAPGDGEGGGGAGDPLANTQWTLVSMGAPGAETAVTADRALTLEFQPGGQMGGNGGCNSFGGSYQVAGNTITFGEIVSTLMACADQAVTAQEQQYLAALQGAERFEVTGDTLVIFYSGGQEALTFTRS